MTSQVKIASVVAVLMIGLGVALWLAQPDDLANVNNSSAGHEAPSGALGKNQLVTDVNNFDFGTISMKNGKVNKIITLTNTNTEVVAVRKLYTSCMCTEAFVVKNGTEVGPYGMPGHGALKAINENLQPSGTLQVKVVFDPNAHGPSGVGVIERDVIAEDETGKIVSFHFKVNVIP